MEYAQYPGLGTHFDPSNPTKHQLAFVHMLKDHLGDFLILRTASRNERVLAKIAPYLAEACNTCPDWDTVPASTRALFDFYFPRGQEQANGMAENMKIKKRRRGKKRTTPSLQQGDVPFVYKRVLLALFEDDDTRIKARCAGNKLLEGLVEGMPGVRAVCDGENDTADGAGDDVEGGEKNPVLGVEE
jgi:hypothetical protein